MDLRICEDPAGAAAAWIAERLRSAIRHRRAATLALSGGSTAPTMIDALCGCEVAWSFVTVWQVDERVAPDGDSARNANQLGLLPCTVRLMPVSTDDRSLAADEYAGGLPERFDLVHLGVGDDGHTASWPPGEPAIADSERFVELSSFNGYERMTLTRRVVNAARERVVLAVGASKRPVIERWLLDDTSLPIARVKRAHTLVFVDEAAGPHPDFSLSSVAPDASYL